MSEDEADMILWDEMCTTPPMMTMATTIEDVASDGLHCSPDSHMYLMMVMMIVR